jgi:hypothetical protein
MWRLNVEIECRIQLAATSIKEHLYKDAAAALEPIPLGNDAALAGEQRAQVHYWRSVIEREQGDVATAASEIQLARTTLYAVRGSLPPARQADFSSRRSVRLVLDEPRVRNRP